jgi:hypothetical protein
MSQNVVLLARHICGGTWSEYLSTSDDAVWTYHDQPIVRRTFDKVEFERLFSKLEMGDTKLYPSATDVGEHASARYLLYIVKLFESRVRHKTFRDLSLFSYAEDQLTMFSSSRYSMTFSAYPYDTVRINYNRDIGNITL